MKNIFIVATLALLSQSAFALTSLNCNAQMLGKTQYAPKTFTAPALVGQGLNSVIRAKHNNDHLFMSFNSQTVSDDKAHVILDGRYRNILMNAHMTVFERNNIVSIALRDTITNKTQGFEFDINADISVSFDNGDALIEIDCATL
ncbi:MAG: hypothetical protein WDA09_08025 [Bacteriovoracaceae bacterium]